MNKREIVFTVDDSGKVEPTVPQYGGMRGEHNRTEIVFSAESELLDDGTGTLRIVFCTGDGAVVSSDLLTVGKEVETTADGGLTVRYPLHRLLTASAGQLSARLICSHFDESGAEAQTWSSGHAVLYFEDAETENGTPFWTGVSEMLKGTANSMHSAVAAAEETRALAQAAQTAADTADQAAERAALAADAAKKAAADTYTKDESDALLARKLDVSAVADAAGNTDPSPISSRAVCAYVQQNLQKKQDVLTFDGAPKAGSQNPVTSGGIYDFISGKLSSVYRYKGSVDTVYQLNEIESREAGDVYNVEQDGMNYAWTGEKWDTLGAVLKVDSSVSESGFDAVNGHAVASYVKPMLKEKQDVLTFDEVPTSGSTNPVTSGGIAAALEGLTAALPVGSMVYKGQTTGPVMMGMTDMTAGDVWFVTTNEQYYLWTGEEWKAITGQIQIDSAVTESGTSPVSGAAVYTAISDAIAAYDSDVAALLGEDGDSA